MQPGFKKSVSLKFGGGFVGGRYLKFGKKFGIS
jgi:hypothetical protein